MELPECPVCLQPFDAASTIPRVLGCGHSTCQSCLAQLPKIFPGTIRCPSCTQLVKFSSPSSFPKNIDLLRISSFQAGSSTRSEKTKAPQNDQKALDLFVPIMWSHRWRKWILPSDCIEIESQKDPEKDGLFTVYSGRIAKIKGCNTDEDYDESLMGCFLEENEEVCLVKIATSVDSNDDFSKFKYSYTGEIMRILHGMNDEERKELDLILRASFRLSDLRQVFGFWYNSNDHCLYLVSKSFSGALSKIMGGFKSRHVGENEENLHSVGNLAMAGLGACECVSNLHLEGLVLGCLSVSCFSVDNFGRVYVDIGQILVIGRRVGTSLARVGLCEGEIFYEGIEGGSEDGTLECHVFISPEVLYELLSKVGVELSPGCAYEVGYGSDVWSLACLLLLLLFGEPFAEAARNYSQCLVDALIHRKSCDYREVYISWVKRVMELLESKLSSELSYLKDILTKSIELDPGKRPVARELWQCVGQLTVQSEFAKTFYFKKDVVQKEKVHCLVLGELCQLVKEIKKASPTQTSSSVQTKDEDGRKDFNKFREVRAEKDLVESLTDAQIKCIDLKGHLDCVTGLAVGGGFLFSSSFDKAVHVWSLEEFTHVHSFKGHEHKVTAVVFVDDVEPLCVSGDNEGVICIWGASFPLDQAPIKKLYEKKDWRYSGIHALAVYGAEYLYTGSGDKSIKAWSLKDYTLSGTMTGHKSVVSSLAVCNGVLFSGSWDGTIRLWCLSDHSPLAVLGEERPGNISSVLSLAAEGQMLIAAYENGFVKIWHNDVLLRSVQTHSGAVFAVSKKGKWIFSGGWDKNIYVQELSGDEAQMDAIGSIACNSVITALLYWQGKLFVGQADRIIKVYYSGHWSFRQMGFG